MSGGQKKEFKVDAIPFVESNSFNQENTESSQARNFCVNPTSSSPISLVINHLEGPANIGGTFNIHGQGNTTGQCNTVFLNYLSDGSKSNSDVDDESEDEPIIDENILGSALRLSVKNMDFVAENIGSKYVKLARYFKGANFNTAKINNIIDECRDLGRVEGIFRIMERWSQIAPSCATVGNLAEALGIVDRIDLANRLSLDNPDELSDQLDELSINKD